MLTLPMFCSCSPFVSESQDCSDI